MVEKNGYGRGEWERKVCMQTGNGCGSRGWEENLVRRDYAIVMLEVEN